MPTQTLTRFIKIIFIFVVFFINFRSVMTKSGRCLKTEGAPLPGLSGKARPLAEVFGYIIFGLSTCLARLKGRVLRVGRRDVSSRSHVSYEEVASSGSQGGTRPWRMLKGRMRPTLDVAWRGRVLLLIKGGCDRPLMLHEEDASSCL